MRGVLGPCASPAILSYIEDAPLRSSLTEMLSLAGVGQCCLSYYYYFPAI